MKKEERNKIFIALSAYLPYKVKLNYEGKIFELQTLGSGEVSRVVTDKDGTIRTEDEPALNINGGLYATAPKLYLRPMSSMTEEEREYLEVELGFDKDLDNIELNDFGSYSSHRVNVLPLFDWLNSHHLDWRGLIEKGLALEAPEEMYN